MPAKNTPVIFIHGLWLHHTSWGPWEAQFAERGYQPSAPGWPGTLDTVEAQRADPASVANKGIDDVVAHYAAIIDRLTEKPILIGHSFGGLIVEKLLGQDRAAAGVAIDPAQIKGVLALPLPALRVASAALKNPANRKRAVSLTQSQFRYGFGNAVSEEESNELYGKWAVASPGKPLFEVSVANFLPNSPAKVATDNQTRGPLLFTLGGNDHTVPPAVVRGAYKLYGKSSATTELIQFPDKGHSLALDAGSGEVVDAVLGWLDKQGL